MEEGTTIKDEIRMLREELSEVQSRKRNSVKGFRMPAKAKLKNTHLIKGYATIMIINENGGVEFRRERIVDSTVKLDDTFHAVDRKDILTYKGKPLIIQSKIKKNPWNPNEVDNQTYGQKHIMSRMMNEVIQGTKKKMTLGMSIGVLIILGIIIYAFVAG